MSAASEGRLPEICHMTFPLIAQFSHVATRDCKKAWRRDVVDLRSAREGKMKEIHREVGSKR